MNRRSLHRAMVTALASVCVLAASPLAVAADEFEAEDDGTGQRVVFKDDPLAALPEVARGATILVRPGALRSLLLRPRTQFVSEMLKSVENL